MDRITKNLLQDFANDQNLTTLDESKAFEHFCNFCVVSKEYSDTFDVDDVSVGDGDDTGLDGVAVLVNGTLVTTEDEVADLCDTNGYLEAIFILVQAKTSSNFDTSDIGQFCFGVKDFFSESPKLPRNKSVARMAQLQEFIYTKSALMTKGKPSCRMFYITTGKWRGEAHPVGRISSEVSDIKDLGLFEDVRFDPVDADGIQNLYRDTKNKVAAEFNFSDKTVLPGIEGVTEAYLGVLPATEYLRLITDESGNIRKSLFYDNVRDFQDYNDVNKEVRATLQSANQDRFAMLNNGVTVVAKSLNTVGNKFHIEDYQIVNGCQTSHVLYNERESISPSVFVPIKVISTADDTITNEVIKATNRQTQVKTEELYALTDFEKKLESYYATYEGRKQLFYERRSKQYNGVPGVEKVRIITRAVQIKAFASMFLDEPHRAGRYYGTLLKTIGDQLFSPEHLPLPYYTSAFAHYKLEYLFRNASLNSDYKPFRYHLLMILRHQIGGTNVPQLSVSRKMEPYCLRLLDVLWDDDRSLEAFAEAIKVIDAVSGRNMDRDTVKTQVFTEKVRQAFL